MAQITAFSVRDIGDVNNPKNQRLEDFCAHERIETAGGLELQIALVCDGAGGGQFGERASRLAAETILSSLRQSQEQHIPQLLIDAIEDANVAVYDELQGSGYSTAAVIAIDVKDNPPYGRIFIASVGDSPIFVMRSEKSQVRGEKYHTRLIRLNTDHTVLNEHILQGGDPRDLDAPNPHALTRALGRDRDDTGVDVGIYTERGKDFVSPGRAQQIGTKGLKAHEGDTIFAVSDGVTDINPDDGLPFIHEEEFINHTLDDNVERAAKILITYAMSRRPNDNVSIALIFIPGDRTPVQIGGLSRTAKIALTITGALATLVILALIFSLRGSQSAAQSAEQTATRAAQVALAEYSDALATRTQTVNEIFQTQTAVVLSATPTPTLTPTFTLTPLPTATPRATLASVDQIGLQKFLINDQLVALINAQITSPGRPSYVLLTGDQVDNSEPPAEMIMLPDSNVNVSDVDNRPSRLRVSMSVNPDTSVLISPQRYVGGVDISVPNQDVSLFSDNTCFSVNYTPSNDLALGCYAGDKSCTYRVGTVQNNVPVGQQVHINLQGTSPIVSGMDNINGQQAEMYYTTVLSTAGTGDSVLSCLMPFADKDQDHVVNSQDACRELAGPMSWPDYPQSSGCPDTDNDGVPDNVDQCPAKGSIGYGITKDGCPIVPTAVPDRDHDGVPDNKDACPNEAGLPSNNGCPIIPTFIPPPPPSR